MSLYHPDRINMDRRSGAAFITRYGWAAIFTLLAAGVLALAYFTGRTQ
jgi:hypothetical protein